MISNAAKRVLLRHSAAPPVQLASSRGILKHAIKPEPALSPVTNRPIQQNDRTASPSRIQQKSTLTPIQQNTTQQTVRNTASIAVPGLFEDEQQQPSQIAPPPRIDTNDNTTVAAVPKVVRTIPKSSTADPYCNEHFPKLNVARFLNTNILSDHCYQRKVKTDKISKYLSLISPVVEEGEKHSNESRNKPLTIICPWLMAKDKHVEKYTRLYTDLGIDVLRLTINPLDLLRPVPRAQVAAVEVLEYLLEEQQWSKLLLHGMSVGAYGFMEVMAKMEAKEDRYLCIRPRFAGQVWDSPCDLPGLKEGVSRSISSNRVAQEKIMDLLEWFLKVRYEAATRHYVKTQDMYHKNYCQAPSLFLYSRADPVSEPFINTDLANGWYKFGFEVFSKVFNESMHVGHYPMYRAQYNAHLMAFMEHIGMLRQAGIHLD